MRFSVIRKAKYMKDKRILNGWMAYVFHECEDGIIMSDSQGLVTSARDIKELCEGLLKFIGKHSEDIEEYNLKRNAEIERDMRGYSESSSKRKGTRKKGYVYLLECGGRYKIGFSLIIGFQYICDYLHLVHQFFRNIFAGKFKYSIETMLTDTCGCVQ